MNLREFILKAIEEDAPFGDITSEVFRGRDIRAIIFAKGEGVFCGDIVLREFEGLYNFKVKNVSDGYTFKYGDVLGEIKGDAYDILLCERTALNIVSRLCGIATLTRRFVELAGDVPIYDTRKTMPLMRYMEKYAVRVGGGYNHRLTLSEIAMVKDNHKRIAGGIKRAVEMIRERFGRHVYIEVEVENLDELKEALECGVDWVLLDNMDVETLKKAINLAKGRVKIEVSGGVSVENVKEIASLKPDRISVGAITKAAKPIDMSLEVVEW